MAWKPMGQLASGERLQRMSSSPQWQNDKFRDVLPRAEPEYLEIIPKWLETPVPFRRPDGGLTAKSLTRADFAKPPESGLRITWLGHSTLIVEIANRRVLIDPVWGEYVAPLELENARRFIPPPLPFDELPELDAVIISHDHYDHLDYPTIQRLAKRGVPFYVPLGVGAHLAYWGVAAAQIKEHDWWDESILGDVTIACTPARHFSGRSLPGRDKTLWAGWALVAGTSRVFYSGDTALFPGFKEIGRRYGPFNATLLESGAYNQLWSDVHLGPEQAIEAHQMLGGGLLIPVHWGMFDLGLHGWTEPIERILVAAEKAGVQVATLKPGESVEPENPAPARRWWPDRPWQSAAVTPVRSTGLD